MDIEARARIARMWVGLALVATGCTDPSRPGEDGSDTAAATSSPSESTSTTDEESTTSDTEGGVDPDLGPCHALPAATIAQWHEGDELESSAVSSDERIAAVGAPTWQLALELLAVTDPIAHPSVASSPAAMALALGMSHQRFANTMCSASIHQAVGWAEDGDALYQTLGASISTLESRALPADEEDGADPVELHMRPSSWELAEGDAAPPSDAASVFGGKRHAVSKSADGALAAINEVMNCVIESESNGLLDGFVPPSLPASDTTSFDVSVAYLRAPWANSLFEDDPLAFTRDGGEQVELPAMFGTVLDASYYTDDELVAVELPLRGYHLAVLLVMPQADAFADLQAFGAALTPEQLALARSGAAQGNVDLSMPKVAIPSTTIDYYPLLGLDCELFTLRTVLHGASVTLDEKGIEAAAATVDEGWETGTGPGESLAMVTFDRPFLFFVYDHESDHVLYSGRFAG